MTPDEVLTLIRTVRQLAAATLAAADALERRAAPADRPAADREPRRWSSGRRRKLRRAMPTTVISVRGVTRDGRADLLADPTFAYVGRFVIRPIQWKASPYGNPFKVGMSRAAAIEVLNGDIDCEPRASHLDARLACRFYRAWALRVFGVDRIRAELGGKRLGCWCGRWPERLDLLCHAVVLARLADSTDLPPAASGEESGEAANDPSPARLLP